jgi:uncharacterized protein YbjT (DUF2867 family)
MGARLIPELTGRGHRVRALARPGSEGKLPAGCELVTGNALQPASFRDAVCGCDTLVHLVGVPHPGPAKAKLFETIDLPSAKAAIGAAQYAGVRHFVYVSVAQPAPVMKAFIAVRAQGEALVRASGLNATVLRPWYVLGPGHRWPYLLLPGYWIAEWLGSETAKRLGLVTIRQMVAALRCAVESPPSGVRVVEATEIRQTR